MNTICKNCHQTFSGNYCSNCSQSAETHRLDIHFIWHDIQHGLFHFDKGIFYSAKELFTRPGHTIREYIEGQRVQHFKPISLIIVLATLYGLIYHLLHINLMGTASSNEIIDSEKFNEWVATHFAWVTLATIPFYTLGTYLSFRKQNYNITELFILNTFKGSQRLFFHIFLLPVYYYFNHSEHIKTVTAIVYFADIILIFWTNIQFFNKISKTKAFVLSILSHVIFLIAFIAFVALGIFIFNKMHY